MAKTVFGALVVVLGLQSIRFLFGSLTWYLRDTVGIGVLDLIPIALGPFLAGALLVLFARRFPVSGVLWLGASLLAVTRIVNQVSGSPAVDLWAAMVAVAVFVGLLPLLHAMGRPALVGGLLLGLAVDSAIRGASQSLDLAHHTGPWPLLVVVVLAAAMLLALRSCPPATAWGAGWGPGLTLLGIGPYLFFQLLILQNQGWTAEVVGIGGHTAQLRIAALNVVALVLVTRYEHNRRGSLAAVVVLVVAAVVAEGDPRLFNLATLVAVPAAGMVWSSMVPDPDRERLGTSAAYLVAGMTLFVSVGLLYYVPLDIDLGFDAPQVRLAAAGLLGLLGVVGAVMTPRTRAGVPKPAWGVAVVLLVLPAWGFFGPVGSDDGPSDLPLRVASYNIHSSFDTDGTFDIDAIAAVIEESGATVVGFQEIPRGRLLSGVSDQFTLLQHRLGFEHAAFFGTTDPTWGNAVLSRFPITDVATSHLPRVGTPMQRGYLGVTLDVGGTEVLVISTHLQHVNDRAVHRDDPEGDLYPVHREQIDEIMAAWGGVEPAVLVGDFNARPDWQQIADVLDVGWVDSWLEAGDGDGFTARSNRLRHRIDYVFHTPGLVATDAFTIQSLASDHLLVAVDLELGG